MVNALCLQRSRIWVFVELPVGTAPGIGDELMPGKYWMNSVPELITDGWMRGALFVVSSRGWRCSWSFGERNPRRKHAE